MKDKITESKIERTLFTMVCPRCNQPIKGTSRKQLKHTFSLHQLYCKIKKVKKEK